MKTKLTKDEKQKLHTKKKEEKAEAKREKIEIEGTLREQYANLVFAYKFLWKTNKKLFLFRIPLILLQTAQTLVPIFFVRAILNELTIGRDIRMVILYALIMAGSAFAIKLLSKFFERWDSIERTKLDFASYEHFSDSIMELSYSSLEDPKMQDLRRLAYQNRFDHVLQLTTAIASSLITLISVAALVTTLNPIILCVIIVSSLVRFFIDCYQRKIPNYYNGERTRKSRINEYYNDLMGTIACGKDIRVWNLENWLYNKVETSWRDDLFSLDCAFQKKLLFLGSLTGLVGALQDIAVYVILAVQVVSSTMTVGDFSMYLTAASTFSGAVMGVSGNYSNLLFQTSWYLKQYRECLAIAEKQKTDGGHTHIEIPENVRIEFRDVSFKYPKTDRMILEHVSITIDRGETLSIVGENGAGKTTFVKLLCRFYEPTEGEIFVNGIPAADIPLEEYYRLLGVVFQDFCLFGFSVNENIAMDTEFDSERIDECVRKCGLESRIKTLPKGQYTYLYKNFDPDGIELSGGEGQKIAIARAVYRRAPIVIFDEPTSALDPIAEYDIYRNFHDLAENRTAIYISHRLSSTRFTDKTAVFANGTIAEFGTHDELMQIENGIYKEMFSMQAKYYRE